MVSRKYMCKFLQSNIIGSAILQEITLARAPLKTKAHFIWISHAPVYWLVGWLLLLLMFSRATGVLSAISGVSKLNWSFCWFITPTGASTWQENVGIYLSFLCLLGCITRQRAAESWRGAAAVSIDSFGKWRSIEVEQTNDNKHPGNVAAVITKWREMLQTIPRHIRNYYRTGSRPVSR